MHLSDGFMSTSHLALICALVALVLSITALHRSTSQSRAEGTEYSKESAATPLNQTVSVPTSTFQKAGISEQSPPRAPVESHSSFESRQPISSRTYQGNGEIVNIGDDLEVDDLYYGPIDERQTINLGPDLDAN